MGFHPDFDEPMLPLCARAAHEKEKRKEMEARMKEMEYEAEG
jgi:hypothetical protein